MSQPTNEQLVAYVLANFDGFLAAVVNGNLNMETIWSALLSDSPTPT